MSTEVDEIKYLISLAKHHGVINALNAYAATLPQQMDVDTASTECAPIDISPAPKINRELPIPQVAEAPRVEFVGAYTPITDFAWDQGSYNSPTVTIYVDLENVGSIKDNVKCDFTNMSFDLKVHGLNGRSYRLINDNLEKDIVPSQSKITVKKNKIVITLQKVKGEYSYEQWTQLTSKKTKEQRLEKASKDKDPAGGIMDMMKEMYDSGDDNMKKIIGEAMMKSRSGEKMEPPSL